MNVYFRTNTNEDTMENIFGFSDPAYDALLA